MGVKRSPAQVGMIEADVLNNIITYSNVDVTVIPSRGKHLHNAQVNGM